MTSSGMPTRRVSRSVLVESILYRDCRRPAHDHAQTSVSRQPSVCASIRLGRLADRAGSSANRAGPSPRAARVSGLGGRWLLQHFTYGFSRGRSSSVGCRQADVGEAVTTACQNLATSLFRQSPWTAGKP